MLLPVLSMAILPFCSVFCHAENPNPDELLLCKKDSEINFLIHT
jgi:hypothetical protein